MTRYDKIGRKIPDFDRSVANKKAAQTKLKNDPEFFSRIGALGGKTHGRGYLGKLKDENPEELAKLQNKAVQKRKANTGQL